MKKKNKLTKEEKQGIVILLVITILIILVIANIINVIRVNSKQYEYYKDGEFGRSKECYLSDKGDCMCKIDNNFIWVESYYEVD